MDNAILVRRQTRMGHRRKVRIPMRIADHIADRILCRTYGQYWRETNYTEGFDEISAHWRR